MGLVLKVEKVPSAVPGHFSDPHLLQADFLGRGKGCWEERASLVGWEGKKWWTLKNVVFWGEVMGHVFGRTQPGKKCMNMFWDIS